MNIFQQIATFFDGVAKQVEGTPGGLAAVTQFNQGLQNVATQLDGVADAAANQALAFVPLGLGLPAAPFADAVLNAIIAKLQAKLSLPVPAAPTAATAATTAAAAAGPAPGTIAPGV